MLKKYLVNASVTDLRREPQQLRNLREGDPLQETQLLFGEKVMGLSENNGWIYVTALEQKKYLPDGQWCGYPGWVKAEDLVVVKRFLEPTVCVSVPWTTILKGGQPFREVCLGTKLRFVEGKVLLPDGERGEVESSAIRPLSKKGLNEGARADLLKVGKSLVDTPYFWGGRSVYQPEWKERSTSLDCSGLVNLLYRLQGVEIARDAHDQFLQCERCEVEDLEEGDLVFLAGKEGGKRISHVMLFAGGDHLLEANGPAKKIRMTTGQEMLGKSLELIRCGEAIDSYRVYFGKLLTQSKFPI